MKRMILIHETACGFALTLVTTVNLNRTQPWVYLTNSSKVLQKPHNCCNTDIRDIFKGGGRLVDDSFIQEFFEKLVKTDMGVEAAQELVDEVVANFKARVVEENDVLELIKQKLKALLAQPAEPIRFAAAGPTVIMVAGVNGCGKTTSIAKLGQMFLSDGKKVILGAADTFRAAAVAQLTVWADRLGCEIVTGASGSDPASVAHRTVARAMESGCRCLHC